MKDLYLNEDNQSFYNSRPECMTLRINQEICAPCPARPVIFGSAEDNMRDFIHGDPPHEATQILLYDVPLDVLQDDVNVIEFEPPQVDGRLVWAEMLIAPAISEDK